MLARTSATFARWVGEFQVPPEQVNVADLLLMEAEWERSAACEL